VLPHQRQWARNEFRELLAGSHGCAFEEIFDRLMELCHPGYVAVRTHGSMGDLGCDGLGLHDRTLYACYAPETVDPGEIRRKFRSDVLSAMTQRPEQFDNFTFVHNDPRGGIHPVVSGLLVEAQSNHPSLKFHELNPRKLWNSAVRLDEIAMTLLLGVPELPVQEVVYGIGLREIQPLLDHLRQERKRLSGALSVAPPPATKLAYNALNGDYVDAITAGFKLSHVIDDYYSRVADLTEHDEVAAGFNAHYQQVRSEHPGDPDAVMWEMEVYVLGNRRSTRELLLTADAVLAHFFERCDIFDRPPADWQPGQSHGWA